MKTLLLPPRYTEDSIRLWRAAIAVGWQVERLSAWHVPPIPPGASIALYGEPLFAAHVAQALELALIEPNPGWLAELPYVYRLRELQLTTLEEARRYPDTAFIKPADEKSFPAQVYASGSSLPLAELLPGSLPVLISEPVAWEIEFRCFVLEGEVVTLSPYLRDGEVAQGAEGEWPVTPEELAQVRAFTRTLLSDPEVRLPPAVVLDVGRIRGRGWAAVELNPAWASGLYGCEPGAVLPLLARGCIPAGALSPEDAPWVIQR